MTTVRNNLVTYARGAKITGSSNLLAPLSITQDGQVIPSNPVPGQPLTVQSIVQAATPTTRAFQVVSPPDESDVAPVEFTSPYETCVSAVNFYEGGKRVWVNSGADTDKKVLYVEVQSLRELPANADLQLWDGMQLVGRPQPWQQFWQAEGGVPQGFVVPSGVLMWMFKIQVTEGKQMILHTQVPRYQPGGIFNYYVRTTITRIQWINNAHDIRQFTNEPIDARYGTVNQVPESVNFLQGEAAANGLELEIRGAEVWLKGVTSERRRGYTRARAVAEGGEDWAVSGSVDVWTQDHLKLTQNTLEFEVWDTFSLNLGAIEGWADTAVFQTGQPTPPMGALALANVEGGGSVTQNLIYYGASTDNGRVVEFTVRLNNTSFIPEEVISLKIRVVVKSRVVVEPLTEIVNIAQEQSWHVYEVFKWTNPADRVIKCYWDNNQKPRNGTVFTVGPNEVTLQFHPWDLGGVIDQPQDFLYYAETVGGVVHGPYRLRLIVRYFSLQAGRNTTVWTGNTGGLPNLSAYFKSYWPFTVDNSGTPKGLKAVARDMGSQDWQVWIEADGPTGVATGTPSGPYPTEITNTQGDKIKFPLNLTVQPGQSFDKQVVPPLVVNRSFEGPLVYVNHQEPFARIMPGRGVPGMTIRKINYSFFLSGTPTQIGVYEFAIEVSPFADFSAAVSVLTWKIDVVQGLTVTLGPDVPANKVIQAYYGEPMELRVATSTLEVFIASQNVPAGFVLEMRDDGKQLWLKGSPAADAAALKDLSYRLRSQTFNLEHTETSLKIQENRYRGITLGASPGTVTFDQISASRLLILAQTGMPNPVVTATVTTGTLPAYTSLQVIPDQLVGGYGIYLVGSTPEPMTRDIVVTVSDGRTSKTFSARLVVNFNVKAGNGPMTLQRGTTTDTIIGSYTAIDSVSTTDPMVTATRSTQFTTNLKVTVPPSYPSNTKAVTYKKNGVDETVTYQITGTPVAALDLIDPAPVPEFDTWTKVGTVVAEIQPTVSTPLTEPRFEFRTTLVQGSAFAYTVEARAITPSPLPATVVPYPSVVATATITASSEVFDQFNPVGYYLGPKRLQPADQLVVAGTPFQRVVGILWTPSKIGTFTVGLALPVAGVQVLADPAGRNSDGTINILASGTISETQVLALRVDGLDANVRLTV